jgi:hypothetical protein
LLLNLAAGGADLSRLALEALGLQEYRARRLSAAQLQRTLGYDTRWEVDEFLKKHGIELEYTPADLERGREAHRQLGL